MNRFGMFVKWYFIAAPRQILIAGRNLLIFGWHFFSIGYFLPRLLAPWHRDLSGYGRGFDLKRFLHVFGWNLISRVIGAFVRICVMVIGILFEVLAAASVTVWFVTWYLLPLISLLLIILGLGSIWT